MIFIFAPLFILAVFFVFYAVGFALFAFVRRWYLLISGATIFMVLLWFASQDLDTADTPGAFFAYLFIAVITLGAVAGFLASAVLLTGRWFEWGWSTPRSVRSTFFVGTPLLIWLPGTLIFIIRQL